MGQQESVLMGMERPQKYIGRPPVLQKIYNAIYTGDKLCHVVLIKGAGGLGKTRLLEEVMSRLGREEMRTLYPYVDEDWNQQHPSHAVVSRLFDFIHIHLHSRNSFLETLGKPLNWSESVDTRFHYFQAAVTKLTRQLDAGTSFSTLEEAEKEMLEAFWKDYRLATRNQRLVIPLDTAEQLALLGSKWLTDQELLTDDDLEKNTQQWLIKHLVAGDFANTTFLIAGRAEEGRTFFGKIEEALHKAPQCRVTFIDTDPFSIEEISQFCMALAEDSRGRKTTAEQRLANDFEDLAHDHERLQVLKIFTEGQPVRLALYTDILIEGQSIPAPLLCSLTEAQEIAQNKDRLQEAQRQIEQEFVFSLFRRPTLRSEILLALARATRGLNAQQLHYILYSQHDQQAKTWMDQLETSKRQAELAEILDALRSLSTLSIVKFKNRFETEDALKPYGLQDEVYRIYSECMKSEASHHAETEARRALYLKIIAWLEPQRVKGRVEQRKILDKQLERIEIERPDKILYSQIPYLNQSDEEARRNISYKLVDLDLEYLHYQLLLDPTKHFNDTYFDLGYNKDTARDLVEGALFQAELTRTLNEPHTTAFIDWHSLSASTSLGDIQRKIEQSSVARWLLFFAMHGRPKRTIELFGQIEAKVAGLPADERESWQSTAVSSERLCWYIYALSLSDSYPKALELLEIYLPLLEALAPSDYTPQEENQTFVYGGTPEEKRVIFLVAEMHNTWGYILTQTGSFQHAVRHYTKAQQMLRYAGGFHSQLAYVLNNQARALAEMGLKRAERICLDALELRLQEGALLPIALSYNTLGLIYNLFHRAPEAMDAAARAYAIAKFIGDERTLGLVHIQLAISLRRLVSQQKRKYRFSGESEAIYRQAETCLHRALEQFQHLQIDNRPSLRLIETYIELGCLYRSKVADIPVGQETHSQYQAEATNYFLQAIVGAEQLGLDRLLMDAQVNLAWVYGRSGHFPQMEALFEKIEKNIERIAPSIFFREGQDPPQPSDDPNSSYRPHYIFKQLNKVESFKGRMALEQFQAITENYSHHSPEKRAAVIEQRNKFLADAARAFAFASSYAELFAPNSHALNLVYNDLYEYAKKFNPIEMHIYYEQDRQIRKKYRLNKLRPLDAGDTRSFLLDTFGNYYEGDDPEDEG